MVSARSIKRKGREFVRAAAALARYGVLRRHTHVTFLGCGRIYADPADARGKALLQRFGVTQPAVTVMWRRLVRQLCPTLILDIGSNYGEIAFCTRYKTGTKIILFEPNSRLEPFLRASIASRSDAASFELRTELVSDRAGSVAFYVDRKWSGTSSAIGPVVEAYGSYRGSGVESGDYVSVPAVTIDQVCSGRTLANEYLLFKIDVEGFEGKVLAGMTQTLGKMRAFAGILEFDRRYLARAGTDPDAFFATLRSTGEVYILRPQGCLPVRQLSDLPDHIDLLVARPPFRV